MGGTRAIFLMRVQPHPLYPGLVLIIWKMDSGNYSFDALGPRQDVGNLVGRNDPTARAERLMRMFDNEFFKEYLIRKQNYLGG